MKSVPYKQIVDDLRILGVRADSVLLVHASLRALGPVEGGAEVVIRGLLEALGPDGTLLMPALSYETVGAANPCYDVLRTPSCVGALPEYFRTRPGTLRSVHPTHSVCGSGPRAAELLDEHIHARTPVGPESPFAKLPHTGGQVLFLGCGLRPNTSIHGVEEYVIPPYLYGEEVDYQIILADGCETRMRVRSHNFAGFQQRYDRIEDVIGVGMRRGRVLRAKCHLLEAEPMWETALAAMRTDPLYFVERAENME